MDRRHAACVAPTSRKQVMGSRDKRGREKKKPKKTQPKPVSRPLKPAPEPALPPPLPRTFWGEHRSVGRDCDSIYRDRWNCSRSNRGTPSEHLRRWKARKPPYLKRAISP